MFYFNFTYFVFILLSFVLLQAEMPPPVDPYASLSSIAALSAQMNGFSNPSRNSSQQQVKSSSAFQTSFGDDIWSAFGSETSNNHSLTHDERRRREEQEKADFELAQKLQHHDHSIPHRPPPPVPSHRMPNQSNGSHSFWK